MLLSKEEAAPWKRNEGEGPVDGDSAFGAYPLDNLAPLMTAYQR